MRGRMSRPPDKNDDEPTPSGAHPLGAAIAPGAGSGAGGEFFIPEPSPSQTDETGGDTETITRQWDPERAREEARARMAPPTEANPPLSLRMTMGDLTLEPALLDEGFNERYELREVIGRGGMGEVRLCKDRHIGREVAIKVIRTDHMTRPDVVRRFEREARVQGQLEHPAIVPVYDFGIAPDGSMYFTMKRLRGVTFHDVLWMLRNGDPQAHATYSRRKLLSAFTRACLAVAFAHSRGVLHRDLKPSNIMLGDFGEVYVLDWGLAKIQKQPDHAVEGRIETPLSSEHRTIVGEVVGTPGYMAPEQALGEVDRLDPRTDVYALGAILFEILTLEPLHKEDSPEDVLLSTLYGPETRPTVRTPGRDVPPELDAIVLRATSVRQEDRFANARELCAVVETFLDGDRDLEQKKQMAGAHAASARARPPPRRGKGARRRRPPASERCARSAPRSRWIPPSATPWRRSWGSCSTCRIRCRPRRAASSSTRSAGPIARRAARCCSRTCRGSRSRRPRWRSACATGASPS